MTMSESADSDALLAEGRRAYAEKRHKKALECFTRVMKRCPCARGSKRERCRCKNFEAVAQRKASIFHEAMYTCSCSVGKTFNKCDAANHIRALDYRAATFEAMGEIERARLDAEWLLELAPRLPEGYLRLGKVARLQKKHEFAWHVYNAGIEATESSPRSALIEKLFQARIPLNQRYARRDPLSLPMEILQMIWSSLDFLTLVRCAQVCKTWRSFLTTGMNKELWKTLHFNRTRKRITVQALSHLLKHSDYDARALLLDDCRRANFTKEKLRAVMLAARNLERLELRQPLEGMPLPEGGASTPGRKIRRLLLEGFNRQSDPENITIPNFVEVCKQLEYLELINCHEPFQYGFLRRYDGPNLPQLRYLRVSGNEPQRLHYKQLGDFAPNLEQVWLECTFTYLGVHPYDHTHTVWPNMKSFTFIHREVGDNDSTAPPHLIMDNLLSQPAWQQLQHLELELFPARGIYNHFQLPQLRTVRLKNFFIKGEAANHCFGASLQAERLQTFAIQFPRMELNRTEGEASSAHLAAHDWLVGSPSIKCLILRGFVFRRWDDPVTGELPTFLASFPNLEEIIIQGTMYEDAELCSVIEGITKACKNLKTLWQDQVKGVMMDKLIELGKRESVEIKTGEPVSGWPMPLERID